MKKFAAVFAATALVGVTTAFAANPFSDVTPDSWAYQSVAQLANAGVINGYPDGTFKGQNNITRYEMAQMVAKAMANQDRANAEQQAMINRLADEFSNELNNLGVRVSNLEDRVGNIKATGDVRLRYRGSEDSETNGKAYGLTNKNSKFDMRGRVQFNANVNENTKAVLRVTSGNIEFGNATGNSAQSSKAIFDRAYVQHNFGKRVTATAGRYNQTIGAGLFYDNTFDGANIKVGNDKIAVEGAYGYLASDAINADAKGNKEFAYAALTGKVGHYTHLGGFYGDLKNDVAAKDGSTVKAGKYYGFNADVNYKKLWVGGEWLKNKDVDQSNAWVAGVGYGNYDISKANTWGVKVQRFDLDKNANTVDSTWNHVYTSNYKGWMATVDYALAKNVGLSGYYGFDSKEKSTGNDKGDFYRAELNYKF